MKHRITVSQAGGRWPYGRLIRRAAEKTLESEQVALDCEVNILLVDDEAIRELNARFRRQDKPTDVLSFPSLELAAGEKPSNADADPDTGRCHLGDVVISVERAREQAGEYGHSLARELAYLTVHSVLHLLGYDHMDEGAEKALMREHEEMALDKVRRDKA